MRVNATGGAWPRLGALWRTARAGEWWEYKLVPIFALFYATALRLGVPVAGLWPAALALLGALIPGAVYVCVVNDLTDREEDAAAGKANRMAGRPAAQAAAMIALPAAAGLAFAWWWRDDPPLLLAYLGAWAAFTLYSVPPFRLKVRGFPGVLADASGSHLFPTLVAVLLVYRQAGSPVDVSWIGAVGLWAAAYGLRGILWHQLSDRDSDVAVGVRTFAGRRRPEQVAALVRGLVFPLECLGLVSLLWLIHRPLPALLLPFYLLLVWWRVRWWQMKAVLVRPQPRYFIFLADYYDVFLPLGLLLASARAHPVDLAVLVAHILLFPRRLEMVGGYTWRLLARAAIGGPRRYQR
jgi:1,4-dihydroxy-2-naphthoate octaprenyltransferase